MLRLALARPPRPSRASRALSAFSSERDLLFNLHDVLDIEASLFAASPRFSSHSPSTVNEAIAAANALAEDKFAGHSRLNDLNEPHFDPATKRISMNPQVKVALEAFYAAGFGAAHADEALGGMQLPQCVTNSLMFPLYAANVGTITFPFLTIAAGNMLRAIGSPEQHQKYLIPMLEGRFTGTMNLSETQAGSSLGDITCKAFPRPDGRFDIVGNKMWISGGEHDLSENIIHMVLAKVADPKHPERTPPGVKGISLFIVPKRRVDNQGKIVGDNDVVLGGLNHKMGWRGATNCVMHYGENGGCVGELLGEEGKGLQGMFRMMNEARISVGLIATALGYAGYAASLQYAKDRKQGRLLDGKDPKAPQVPIIEHPDVKRMLLFQKAAVEASLSLCLYASWLVDRTHHDSSRPDEAMLLDVLTPIVKSWPSEWCLEANKWAIQIHGGYGFTRDFPVEQHYRDNRLNMIHEGTNGIQALDLLGRKVQMQNGKGFVLLCQAIRSDIAKANALGDAALSERAGELSAAVVRLEIVTKFLLGLGTPGKTLANAHEYLNMTGHTVMAWMLLKSEAVAVEQMRSGSSKSGSAGPEDAFLAGKRFSSRFFFAHELPKTVHLANLLQSADSTTTEMKVEMF